MDKFTVDLDQVLNDFEYSELTDQYSTTVKVTDNSSQSVETQNITKHSINNVFHSLNEYLNTSSVANNLETGDNNINPLKDFYKPNKKQESINIEVETYSDVKSKNNVMLNDYIDLSLTHKEIINGDESNPNIPNSCEANFDKVNLKTAAFQVHEHDFEQDILKMPLDIKTITKYDNSENHIDLHTELQNVVGNSFGINQENVPSKHLFDVEKFKPIVGFEEALTLDDQEITKLLSELEEDDEINIDIKETQFSAVNDMGYETKNTEDNIGNERLNIVNVGHNISEADSNKNKICSSGEQTSENEDHSISLKEVVNIKTKEIFNSENCKQVLNSLQTDIDSNNDICSEDTVFLQNDYEETNENIHNDLKVSKTESLQSNECMTDKNIVNKDNKTELLCSEESSNQNSCFPNVLSETRKRDGIESDVFEKKVSLVKESCNDDLEVQEMYCTNEVRQSCKTNLVKQDLPSESTEIEITKNPDNEKCFFNEDLETSAGIQVIDKITDLSSESKENTSEGIPEFSNFDSSKGVEKIDEKNEISTQFEAEHPKNVNFEQNEPVESISRPDNLHLEIQIMENDRKIDLIGDPGSTPYNNVYINDEFAKEKHKDSSTSTSPTFSDASSSASTASTEDIQYKQDLNDTTIAINQNQCINNVGESSQMSYCVNPISPAESNNIADESFEPPQETTDISPVHSCIIGEEPTISTERNWLGKEAPLWIPDSEAISCLHCDMKFTVLKRRHHCRACGLVLCSKCCHLRFRLEYLDAEARVCNRCHNILNKESSSSSSSDLSPDGGSSPSHKPNPNNPSEYCSTISPLQQMSSGSQSPPAVMVPVGVLKRKGSNKAKSSKSVMFCDGIRPGSDLTNLDNDFNYNNTFTKKLEKNNTPIGKLNRNLPLIDSETNTFIPKNENSLPPMITLNKSEIKYTECCNNINTVNMLKEVQLTFAIHLSLNVHVKIINMDCCVNKVAWCFSTEGLINVGQDEIVILLEYLEEESTVPKDVFYHITSVYNDAVKGNSIKEMGLSLQNSPNFLDSKNHAGFVYIRPTFQCLEHVIKPKDPFLIGILIHRWETPWAKLFPLRLILRLGAEYRYYPSPIISTRYRDSVYVEIGHTIINILADFRNFSYSLPQIRGLTIHMEDKITTVNIPVNRYDQVIKSLNNSSDHILAFAGNFSVQADSHLVCIQDTQGNENCYSTHAINIHNRPRKITGASFIVFNGALKSSSGLTAKSNIIEDGLMIQVLPEHLKQLRESLRSMKNYTVLCGCVDNVSDETVQIVWAENDKNFNVGVTSTIDNMLLSGVPSIRVHNGKNYICHNGNRIIRWTEVFIIQNGEDNPKNQDPVDISRVSESIAKATCDALVKYLDLLIANCFQKIGIRVTLHVDNVSYCAGSNGIKLPPIYMKSLDNELIPVLHRITSNNFGENAIVLELIFRILNV